jgi:phosphatidylserine decarboxylase
VRLGSDHEPERLRRRRTSSGRWLPANQDALEDWLAGHRQRVEAKGDIELHPAVVEFQRLIASGPVVGMYVNRMIAQVPETRPCSKRHLENPEQMLRLINEVLTISPDFGDQNLTLPLGAILDWTMGTPAGVAAFRHPEVNAAREDPFGVVEPERFYDTHREKVEA